LVYEQGLVKRALDEVLGEGGWDTESRPSRQGQMRRWVIATDRVKPRSDSVPEPPAEWPPDDEYGPPSDDAIF
jgi:hypothetical protein